jgi:P-type Ca2+ transporter type 2C
MEDDRFWHLRTSEEVLKELESSEAGLTQTEAAARLEQYGRNKLPSEVPFQFFKVLLDKVNSILIYILLAAAIIAFISGEVLEFSIILIIIVMTVCLGFIQEYKADRTIKALNKLTAKRVFVLRDDQKQEVPAETLVPGDIVFLKRGNIVPADLRLLEISGLQIDESIITGESVDRVKISRHLTEENISLGDMLNIAFSSTSVTTGEGMGIVVETGGKTFIGKVSASIEGIKREKSPIQRKIDLMSKRISYIVLAVAFFLFLILILKGNSFHFSLLLIGAVAIAGIPESFPLALTLTFSNGIQSMARQNAIVKDLNSVETLGTTTVICTDKTGTLTENKMRVTGVFLPDSTIYDVKGTGYEPINSFLSRGHDINKHEVKVSKQFINALILCNDSELNLEEDEWKLIGDATEGALLSFAKSLDADENVLREDNKRVFVVPFNPLDKFMISVNKNIDRSCELGFYLKGAGELVLEKCNSFRGSENNVHRLQTGMKKGIIQQIEAFNSRGLRVLSVASKSLKNTGKYEEKFIKDNLENDYTFEGFVGIEDPIRAEVFDAVDQCHKAGIRIVMITGDHRLIAESIGRRLNLFTETSKKMLEGFEIDRLTDRELDDVIGEVAIFARTTPEHKLRIVDSLQRKGEIVAMTGDGVNDAPALKKADIGISMGKNGTEVAREASNMVLTDDNFATIVKAVKEGRTVYSNIRRFIYYLLTGNWTEVGIIFIAVLAGLPLPLTALMILFINLVTSTIPALALSIEPSHEKVMSQKPRNPKERLLSGYILTKILSLIPILILGTLGLFMWELLIAQGSMQKAMTLAFATLITFELFHAFNAKRLHTTIFDKTFFNNPYIFLAIGMSFGLTLLSIYSDFGQRVFSTTGLNLAEWLIIIAIGSLVVVFTEIVKLSIKSEFREQSTLLGIEINLE